MRLFTALVLDAPARDRVAAYMDACRRAGVTGGFSAPGNLHITLHFLGECGRAELAAARDAVETASGTRPFTLRVDGAGAFQQGRVVYLRFAPCEELARMYRAETDALAAAGFEADERRYTPHVTLARRAALPGGLPPAPEIEIPVSALTLFESRRDGGRLVYWPLLTKPFEQLTIDN